MKTAIIIHGMPSKEEYFNPKSKSPSNAHWQSWIQKQLLVKGILAQTPEMPEPYWPTYEAWCKTFEQLQPDEETICIGHSCGAGFFVRWLGDNPTKKLGQVILVAPWIDPESPKYLKTGFFEFTIDENIAERTNGITLIYSTDDDKYNVESAKILAEKVRNIHVQEFTNKGHFCLDDLGTEEFPELLENIN